MLIALKMPIRPVTAYMLFLWKHRTVLVSDLQKNVHCLLEPIESAHFEG